MRDRKYGQLQNSSRNSQLLSIPKALASFSWKQIVWMPGHISFTIISLMYYWRLGQIFFYWKFIPGHSVFRKLKTGPFWRCCQEFRARGRDRWDRLLLPREWCQVHFMSLIPLWQLVSSWIIPHPPPSCALRCGLNGNCTDPAPPTPHTFPPSPEPCGSYIWSACFRWSSFCFFLGLERDWGSHDTGCENVEAVERLPSGSHVRRWFYHPCWFSLVPVCVHSPLTCVQGCDHTWR